MPKLSNRTFNSGLSLFFRTCQQSFALPSIFLYNFLFLLPQIPKFASSTMTLVDVTGYILTNIAQTLTFHLAEVRSLVNREAV